MIEQIATAIPDAKFTIVGENKLVFPDLLSGDQYLRIGKYGKDSFPGNVHFTGKVDDVAPYLAEFDVFGYPLRPDHYGTAEQVLGEAMAAGVVPVVMDNPAEKIILGSDLRARSEDNYVALVEHLYRHTRKRHFLSEMLRDLVQEIYSIDNMISQWNDVFEEMMKQPKKSRGTL